MMGKNYWNSKKNIGNKNLWSANQVAAATHRDFAVIDSPASATRQLLGDSAVCRFVGPQYNNMSVRGLLKMTSSDCATTPGIDRRVLQPFDAVAAATACMS